MDNITQEEKNVVDELRKRTINEMTSKLLEDDSVFYRFAKARDFDLAEAEAMLRKHIAWRKEWKIDSILTDYEPPECLVESYTVFSFIATRLKPINFLIQLYFSAWLNPAQSSVT
ncbi:hypothetical protein AVEN_260757-1 [Araneus ventricosus]|uniref:CRAL/TRIO N-terminal domain-containing protein n=1 Tax=Araneus ventricosus TaxID=182803 RepID=A0A4Y2UZJ3_ARAVE|nr:hypothetical protein AVEN_260757-1 [Araneus ventricosus]